MMASAPVSLIDRLPPLRGSVRSQVSLSRYTWLRVGGRAEILVIPADRQDLCALLAHRPVEVPVCVLGLCSNVLIRDGGIDGVVVRLGRAFSGIVTDGERVRCGAGAADIRVARAAAAAGIGGFEFLSGVPGSIGGAIRMNAGAYGREISDIVESVEAVDGQGERHVLRRADMTFAYRSSSFPPDWICTGAALRGWREDPVVTQERMAAVSAARAASQPIRERTGGSTFANPPGAAAWRLIDQAGCRGLRRGGAMVSEKHCNFLINLGDATASDLESLGEEVRRRVFGNSGICLEWEIHRLGRHIRSGPSEAPQ